MVKEWAASDSLSCTCLHNFLRIRLPHGLEMFAHRRAIHWQSAEHEGMTVKDFLIELAEARLQELERKGILPKGK